MDKRAIELQQSMQQAVTALHKAADELVCYLEDRPAMLERDDYYGDNARAALSGARAWRSMIESPNFD